VCVVSVHVSGYLCQYISHSFLVGVGNCSYNTCSDCEASIGCGWCNAPEETGLGRCIRGGFTSPHDQCPAEDWSWFYAECPCMYCLCVLRLECIM